VSILINVYCVSLSLCNGVNWFHLNGLLHLGWFYVELLALARVESSSEAYTLFSPIDILYLFICNGTLHYRGR